MNNENLIRKKTENYMAAINPRMVAKVEMRKLYGYECPKYKVTITLATCENVVTEYDSKAEALTDFGDMLDKMERLFQK